MDEQQPLQPPLPLPLPLTGHAYDGLSDSSRQFRLLKLHDAASPGDAIECSLETHELDGETRPAAYAALSYTWGSASRDETITLRSGARVSVTSTLVEALRYMRALQRGRHDLDGSWWWIDMICIDQENVEERGQQVALMRDIFQGAQLTVVWLGTARDASDALMDCLTTSSGSASSRRAWTSSPEGKAAVGAFQARPYWHRGWIIQEVCVSHEVLLVCGDRTAPWRALDANHKWLRTYPQAHSVPDLRVLRRRFQDGDLQLGFLVYRAKDAQCANPRDKVYSLLGLVTGGRGLKIVPDYSVSACSVFAAAVRAADDDQAGGPQPRSQGRLWRAQSFKKRYLELLGEFRAHPHDPMDEDDSIRLGCDGLSCGMWDLCWQFCGVSYHLD